MVRLNSIQSAHSKFPDVKIKKKMHFSISHDVYRVIKYQNHLSQLNLPQYISGQ